jgi:hypothetical protein
MNAHSIHPHTHIKHTPGETRDTTELAGGLAFLFDTYLSRTARAQVGV